MSGGLIDMPCLGRPFRLGMLYDCRSDKLIPGMTLWDTDVLHKVRKEEDPQTGSNFEVIAEDTIEKKASHLGLEASLKLSLMGGLVSVSGAANYLDDRTSSRSVARVSLQYKSTSKFEQLGMDQLAIGQIQHPRVFEGNIATHVVTGVLYGAEAFFVFDRTVTKEENLRDVRGKMEVLVKALSRIGDVSGTADISFQGTDKIETEKFQCKFYGDFVLPENPSTFQDAVRIYQQLPKLLGGKDAPKSVPKKVWLYPLCKLDSKVQQIVREISVGLVNDVQKLLEMIHDLEVQSNDIGASSVYQHFKGLREQMSKFRSELSGHRSNLVKKLSVLLPKIRGGGAEEAKLAELLRENDASPFGPQQLSKWLQGKEQEENLLSAYLARLEKAHFEFISEYHLDAVQLNVEKVVCFAFKVGGEDNPYLELLASYMRTGHQPAPASQSVPWYEDREIKKSMQKQLQMFEEFAKANEAQQGIKFVVTDMSLASSTGKNGAVTMLFDGGEFEPPSQPDTPVVTRLLHDRVTLEWSKPAHGSDSITSYTVLYRSATDPEDQWMTSTKPGPAVSITVNALTPESMYSFKVRAECEAGSSPESCISEPVTTKCEPPGQPGTPHAYKVSHDNVAIKWPKPAYGAESITSYTVFYRSITEPGDQWMTCKTAGPQLSTAVSGLAPRTTYSFKVRAECETGFSPESDISHPVTTWLELPSQPGTPRITKASHNNITIEWLKPGHDMTNITRYTVFYRSTTGHSDQWMPHTTTGPQLSTTVHGLTPQTNYLFKVRAESADGFSPDSGISEPATTNFELPSQPGTPDATKVFHDNVTIRWSKPARGIANITNYTVFYRSVTDPGDQWITHNTAGPQVTTTVSGLAPRTTYSFKVRAECGDGFSPESGVSHPVTTRLELPSQPGTPRVTMAFHDNAIIKWSKPKHGADNITSYTVFYCSTTDAGDKWMTQKTGNAQVSATVTNLTPDTVYCFKVRAEYDAGFSPESGTSEAVKTHSSPDSRVAVKVKASQQYSICISESTEPHPHKYVLVTKDVMRDGKNMIAKCIIGSPDRHWQAPERVLMVVGATGAGKSTLINGIANYILGVVWDDKFRFKLITGEGKKSQAESQTTWITAYTFHLRDDSRVPFTLTVIDTPGFGDCEGLERDRKIAEQIKQFFSICGENGIDQLHGVGFVVQGSLARLTPTQCYIFDSILSIFGKDITDNIFMMVTFCDGSRPPVLDALKEAKIPHQKHFKFNNSALYAKLEIGGFDEMFWRLGVQCFGDFLGDFEKAQARSLVLTREVLSEREHLETVKQALQTQIRSGLSKMEQLRQQTEIVKRNKALIEQNRDFTYPITVPKSRSWYEEYKEEETRTSAELKERYDTATQGKSNAERMIANMREQLDQVEDTVLRMVSQVRRSLNRLDEIALKQNPLTVMEYIDLLIEGEKQEGKPGWMNRVHAYQNVKEKAKLMATVQHQHFEKGSVLSSLAGDGACSVESSETGHRPSQSFASRLKSWWS